MTPYWIIPYFALAQFVIVGGFVALEYHMYYRRLRLEMKKAYLEAEISRLKQLLK